MTQTHEEGSRSVERGVQRVVIWAILIVIALVAGYYLAVALIPTPKVGIIYLDTQVGGPLVDAMSQEINYARKARDIKAVVVMVNSPGGGASSGHDIYYQMRKLRDEKPVVASVDILAASAAYQIAVAATEIYAKPASFIGNIGVIVGLPAPEVLSEDFITTGPFKATAFSATGVVQKLDLLYANFRDSVVTERSVAPNELKLSADEVATGELWVGLEAKEYGLIDEIGSKLDAIDRAAELAGLNNYEVVNVRDEYLASVQNTAQYETALKVYEALDQQPEIDLSTENTRWPSFYQLYIPLE
ncbi:MAG: S49 family peptidase [Anaerolineales bacterium]|nr:S49 family peptidase [Anaerolineales bacterium]